MVEAPVVLWPSRREGITRAFRSRFERLSSVPRRNDRRKFGKVGERKPWGRGRVWKGGGGLRMYGVFHCGEAPAFLFLRSSMRAY